ncbi:glycosyltransferase family 4 protein [Mucilaginibacter celer]|uniref:Glycosyltransferase n=1 Tax=Mucilaginibacter celer TaxID=2305508 RepID=A0A494VJM6_9SPHI|nr:glycosyltransferase family 4 protein [Mucilaginibacter celer]AYL95257.1 glycosyltransferase [Mucilaginibacter celer]
MTILLISSFYYPSFVGGAEISVQMLAEGLVKAGNKVYVLVTGNANKVYRVSGVVVVSLKQRNVFSIAGTRNRHPALKVLWHLVDSCNVFYHLTISRLLGKIKPDVVHTNTIQGFSPFIWVAIKNYKIPLIHTTRDYYLLCHKCSLYNGGNCKKLCAPCKITHSLKSRFITLPDHFIGISNFILDRHKPAFKQHQNSSLIYNGVTLPAQPNRADHAEGKICLGYIGRIADDKGVAYLAGELASLGDYHRSRIKVLFAGKGESDFIDELKIKLEGIEHVFLNVVKPQDFYPAIDILIVPALWNEPFGRTVIESLSYSVPVCQADTGGLKELYNPATSWMFTPKHGNLSNLITQIIDNEAQIAIKKQSCRKQAEKFSSTAYIDNHLKLYRRLLPAQIPVSEPAITPGIEIKIKNFN